MCSPLGVFFSLFKILTFADFLEKRDDHSRSENCDVSPDHPLEGGKKKRKRTTKPTPYSFFFFFFIKRENSKTKLQPNQTKKDPCCGAILANCPHFPSQNELLVSVLYLQLPKVHASALFSISFSKL